MPDKLYGTTIGSNYQHQVGPKTAKYFKAFDFNSAAKNYKKLNRDVLVQDAQELMKFRSGQEGFEFIDSAKKGKLFEQIDQGFFQSRYDCENDELVLQPIPYILLFNSQREVFSYVRAENITDYGDTRLFGKHSLGLGGHINREDAPNYVLNCLLREFKEEVKISESNSEPLLLGTLFVKDKAVDRVHFGLIYAINCCGEVKPGESSIKYGRMMSIEEIEQDALAKEKYESWSKVLIPYLSEIYQKVISK